MINDDVSWMARALYLARKGIYSTHPNPRVGCVIVNNGKVVGEGWHRQVGQAHAEVYALKDAGGYAKNATVYVTLEPCSHFGRTPPCVEALIDAQVCRVVIAMQDPNPKVAGKGIERLRSVGIEVVVGVLEQEARLLNKGFIKRMELGLPYISVKLAMSLDGRTAMANGESQWITGTAARAFVQNLRAQSSAVVTGADTVLLDNAKLTVREDELPLEGELLSLAMSRCPLRVLIDSKRRVSMDYAFYQFPNTLTVSNQQAFNTLSNIQQWLRLPVENGHISLLEVVKHLAGEYEVNELLVEAGATLAGAFAQQDLVDEYLIFVAGKFLGSAARPLIDWPLFSMADAVSLTIANVQAVGEDWLFTVYPQKKIN